MAESFQTLFDLTTQCFLFDLPFFLLSPSNCKYNALLSILAVTILMVAVAVAYPRTIKLAKPLICVAIQDAWNTDHGF
jgi:hypothetical protein